MKRNSNLFCRSVGLLLICCVSLSLSLLAVEVEEFDYDNTPPPGYCESLIRGEGVSDSDSSVVDASSVVIVNNNNGSNLTKVIKSNPFISLCASVNMVSAIFNIVLVLNAQKYVVADLDYFRFCAMYDAILKGVSSLAATKYIIDEYNILIGRRAHNINSVIGNVYCADQTNVEVSILGSVIFDVFFGLIKGMSIVSGVSPEYAAEAFIFLALSSPVLSSFCAAIVTTSVFITTVVPYKFCMGDFSEIIGSDSDIDDNSDTDTDADSDSDSGADDNLDSELCLV